MSLNFLILTNFVLQSIVVPFVHSRYKVIKVRELIPKRAVLFAHVEQLMLPSC